MREEKRTERAVTIDGSRDGRAYGYQRGTYDEDLVLCGPGTAGGELLRRYWQPVAASTDATDLPRRIKVLDEDLILFRDKSGRPGLLYPRCKHRGASLLYGKVENEGIRCCYHGWLFDAQGHCLDQPCEPEGGLHRERVRQPWYPVVERYGLIFAYLGPPDREPAFPRFSFDDLIDEGWHVVTVGSVDPDEDFQWYIGGDYNWFQYYENFMDAFHVAVLHSTISQVQFTERLAILPKVMWEYTSDGVRSVQHRDLRDGRIHQRISQTFMPNMNATPPVGDELGANNGVTWTLPLDDTHFNKFGVFFRREAPERGRIANRDAKIGMLDDSYGPRDAHGGPKPWSDWTLEDHQRWPNDYEAQKGLGDFTLHSEENLTSIDRGSVMMRRLFRRQARLVSEGADPIGVTYDDPYLVDVHGGNAILDAQTMECLDGFDARSRLNVQKTSR